MGQSMMEEPGLGVWTGQGCRGTVKVIECVGESAAYR